MRYAIHHGRCKFRGGPLAGRTYEGGSGYVWCVDRKKRMAYSYRAVWPPHRRLRKHNAMMVELSVGPLSKREVRVFAETEGVVTA